MNCSKIALIALSSALTLVNKMVNITVIVANIPPIRMPNPRSNASSGA